MLKETIDKSFIAYCRDRNIKLNINGNELSFPSNRDLLKCIQLLADMHIPYRQEKTKLFVDTKYLVENIHATDFRLGYAGYILDDGTFSYVDEYHADEWDNERYINYPEFSNTHAEDDTCIRLYKEPNDIQYEKLEMIIDKYLDMEGYCKLEVWKNHEEPYSFYRIYSLWDGACEAYSQKEIVGNWTGYKLIQIIKNYFKGDLNESLLTEATRNQLINKSKTSDEYKDPARKGQNRFTRRTKSSIAATVADYNNIDMDGFFKGDILDFGVKVRGETNNYVVKVTFEGVLDELQKEVARNNNLLEFRSVVRAIMNVFNRQDVYVSCSCLHPDTKVKLLDGTNPTVADMKKRFDAGEKLYVYSTDAHGDFKPGEVEKVWITKTTANFIKVILDNGEEILTTPDHPYMLRDGSYCIAADLKEGVSLMPMYFNKVNGYESVKFNSETRGWHTVYKLVADYFKADEIKEAKLRVNPDDNMNYDIAIHHIDFHKQNNNPDNLKIMTAKEHWNYHNSLTWENKPEEMKQHIRETSRANAVKRNANPTDKMLECRHTFIQKGLKSAEFRNHDAECLAKQADLMRNVMHDYYENISEERFQEIKNKRSKSMKIAIANGCLKTDKFMKARHNAFKMERTPEFKLYQQRCKIGKIIQRILDASEIPSPETYEKFRTKGYPKFTSGFSSWSELNDYFKLNHKIAKIEYVTLDETPVYDIKVKDWENFVVSAGVVLHNCPDWKYRQEYWATQGRYNSGTPQTSNGMRIANPNDTKGAGCKHVNLVLSNLNWAIKIASTIHNYINYCKENMQNNYARYIFPVVYGKEYQDVVQMSIFDYNSDGSIKTDLITDESMLNLANALGKVRGQYRSGITLPGQQKFTKKDTTDNTNTLPLEFDKEN